MIYNHNTTPPKPLRDSGSMVLPSGQRVAWSAATTDASLNALGLYRPGTDDPIPAGHSVVSQERVVRDGRSVLVRVTEPAPVVDPQPDQFPNGVETESVVFPHSAEHDWRFAVVDGFPTAVQISASPRVDRAEQGRRMAKAKADIDSAKTGLTDLLASNSVADLKEAIRRMAKLLNLIQ